MIDMIQNAKDIINKGKALNDPELIQMGLELLENNKPSKPQPTEDMYVCTACQHKLPVDRLNRKQCPECKKHKLQIQQASSPPSVSPPISHRIDTEQFNTQVRDKKQSRVRVVDGVEEGVYTHTESIEGIANVWSDNQQEEQDDANEMLKKFTNVSPRTRRAPKMVEITCDNCHKTETMHPIHASGRSRHLCQKCIRRRSQI